MNPAPVYATRIAALVAALERAGVPHCHWKGRAALAAGLRGERDVDLLVPGAAFDATDAALTASGFLRARSRFAREEPGAAHYFAHEPGLERLLHVHLHDAVLSGEDWIASHALPLDAAMLESPDFAGGVRVPTPALEAALTVAKHAIRWGSLPDRIAARLRPKHEGAALRALLTEDVIDAAAAILAAACPAWARADVVASARLLREDGNARLRRRLAARARRALAAYRTASGRRRWRSYARFASARLRRLLDGDRPDKGLPPTGRTLVFEGRDAEAAEETARWLGQAFAVRRAAELARPPERNEILVLVDPLEAPPGARRIEPGDPETLYARVWEALR